MVEKIQPVESIKVRTRHVTLIYWVEKNFFY